MSRQSPRVNLVKKVRGLRAVIANPSSEKPENAICHAGKEVLAILAQTTDGEVLPSDSALAKLSSKGWPAAAKDMLCELYDLLAWKPGVTVDWLSSEWPMWPNSALVEYGQQNWLAFLDEVIERIIRNEEPAGPIADPPQWSRPSTIQALAKAFGIERKAMSGAIAAGEVRTKKIGGLFCTDLQDVPPAARPGLGGVS